jgi:type IV secretory pathway VirB6-like protein
VVTNFVVAFGPLFIALFFFPAARMFFDGWLRCVVGCVLTNIFTIAWLVLFATILTGMLAKMTAASVAGGGADDIVTQVVTMLLAAALVSFFAAMTTFSMVLAVRISGGVSMQLRASYPSAGGATAPSPSYGSGHSHSGGGQGSAAPSHAGGPNAPGSVDQQREYAFNRSIGSAN